MKTNENYTKAETEYFFTKDRELIKKFIELRKDLYEKDESFRGFRIFSSVDNYEYYFRDTTKVLVVLKNGECIGGGCFSYGEVDSSILPLQYELSDKATYKKMLDIFPNLDLKEKICGEFTRVFLLPGYRNVRYFKNIIYTILVSAVQSGVDYVFCMSDLTRARFYKIIMNSFGLPINLHLDIDVPTKEDYEGLKMYVMSFDLNKNLIKRKQLEKTALSEMYS